MTTVRSRIVSGAQVRAARVLLGRRRGDLARAEPDAMDEYGPIITTLRGRGRPSRFNQKIADAILARLAVGESLRSICADRTWVGAQCISSIFPAIRACQRIRLSPDVR